MTPEKLWWKRIPVPNRMVKSTAEELLCGKSIVMDPALPWKREFVNAVIDEVRKKDYSIVFQSFNANNLPCDFPVIDGIADSLGIGRNTKRTMQSIQKELTEKNIWILENLTTSQEQEILAMIRQSKGSSTSVAFVFESSNPPKGKNVYPVRIQVQKMDIRYFAWTLLLENGAPSESIEYSSVLVSELCADSLEKSAVLCCNIDVCLNDPASICSWLDNASMTSCVHKAQMRCYEPRIETRRISLIDRLGDRLTKILPFRDDYNQVIESPYDVEYRHMVHYADELLLSASERAELQMLYNARNALAHLKVLQPDVLQCLSLPE